MFVKHWVKQFEFFLILQKLSEPLTMQMFIMIIPEEVVVSGRIPLNQSDQHK